MSLKPLRLLLALSLLFLSALACNLVTQRQATQTVPREPAATIAAQPAPPTEIPAPLPSPTSLPLYQTITLSETLIEESGKGPDYTLKAVTPVLQGSADPRVVKFNQLAADRVQQAVAQFKQDLAMASIAPIAAGSYFSLSYVVASPPGNLLSLQFHIEGYSDGAAHPYHYTSALNYDLEQGQEITLDQFFLPGADYLQAIADYCSAELGRREIGFEMFSEGALPTPENYAVWNLSPEGLVITFNEYQVAPYAAGPQEVVVPFAALKDRFDPNGPLAQPLP